MLFSVVKLQNICCNDKLSQMFLEEIQRPIKDMLDETSSFIKSDDKSVVEIIKEIRSMLPISKGKKIRSTLLFLLSGANNNFSSDLPIIASSIELFHLSSLIHDDILDNAILRRGEKTLNSSMGNLISVLGGDYLFVNSLNLMNGLKNRRFMDILLNSTSVMVEGQLQEIENNFNYDIDLETYLEIISKKTSSLFGAVTRMSAVSSHENPKIENNFYKFGMDFGNIFQISDDLIDIFSSNSGKGRFRDLEEGKITLPFILLQKSAAKEDVKRYFSIDRSEKLLELLKLHGIEDKSQERLNVYYENCMKFLDNFPSSVYRDSLMKLLDFIRFREY